LCKHIVNYFTLLPNENTTINEPSNPNESCVLNHKPAKTVPLEIALNNVNDATKLTFYGMPSTLRG